MCIASSPKMPELPPPPPPPPVRMTERIRPSIARKASRSAASSSMSALRIPMQSTQSSGVNVPY